MTTAHRALSALVLCASLCALSRTARTQEKPRPPAALGPDSTLAEIMQWLDRAAFPFARVGVRNTGSPESEPDGGARYQPALPHQNVILAQGFRFGNVNDCTLTLKHEDARLLRADGVGRLDERTRYVAELYVPLWRLSDRKGRRPYRHTDDAAKARTFGAWRTEYRFKGFFARRRRTDVGVSIFPAGHREQQQYVESKDVTFTFDDRETSEQFDAAFRRAVRLCAAKR